MPPNLDTLKRMPSSVPAEIRQPFNLAVEILRSLMLFEEMVRSAANVWTVGGGAGGGGGNVGQAAFFPRYLPGAVAFVTAPNQFLAPQTIWFDGILNSGLTIQNTSTATSQSALTIASSAGTTFFVRSDGSASLATGVITVSSAGVASFGSGGLTIGATGLLDANIGPAEFRPGADANVGVRILQHSNSQSGNPLEYTNSTGGTVIAYLNSAGGIGLSSNSVMIQNRAFSWNSTLVFNSACAFTGNTSDQIEFTVRGIQVTQQNSSLVCLRLRPFSTSGGAANVYEAFRSHPQSSGTPAAGFGQRWSFAAQSSTTNDRDVGAIQGRWAVATDASRTGFLAFTVFSTTTEQEGIRITAFSTGCVVTIGNDANYDGLVVNESGEDADERHEGDTATHLLVLDAGLDAVQIGTTVAGVIADFRSAAIVFNEPGDDRDFRVEGNTDANLLFVDAGNDRVGVGTNSPSVLFEVAGNATVTGGVLAAEQTDFVILSAQGVGHDTGLDHGTYTPTRSAETNLGSNVVPSQAQFLRLGNTVTVSGRFTADPTAGATPTSFELSLPLPTSGFANAAELAGVAFCGAVAGQGAEVTASVANGTAVFSWISGDTASRTWSYTYTYLVTP